MKASKVRIFGSLGLAAITLWLVLMVMMNSSPYLVLQSLPSYDVWGYPFQWLYVHGSEWQWDAPQLLGNLLLFFLPLGIGIKLVLWMRGSKSSQRV